MTGPRLSVRLINPVRVKGMVLAATYRDPQPGAAQTRP
jgi:hypothetical protein